MTTWKSILIGQHVASSTQNATFWASSSNVPDDPIMSCFLLVRLLMNHQGKHFQAWRMQKSGSCAARRIPMEDSLLYSYGRKEESISGICMSSTIGIYWGITCITTADWTDLIFVCRGCRGLHCSNIRECIQNHLFWTAPDCFSRTPVITPPCTRRVIVLVAHFSKRQRQESKAVSQNDLQATSSSCIFPPHERQSFLADRQPSACERQVLRSSCLVSPKLLRFSSNRATRSPVTQMRVRLGRKGEEAALPLMLCGAAHTVLWEAQAQPSSPSSNIPATVPSIIQPWKTNFSTCSEEFHQRKVEIYFGNGCS